MIDKIKGLKKGAILYIALIIVLLIIVMNQSGSIKDLESGLSDANDTIISRESSIESMEEKHWYIWLVLYRKNIPKY